MKSEIWHFNHVLLTKQNLTTKEDVTVYIAGSTTDLSISEKFQTSAVDVSKTIRQQYTLIVNQKWHRKWEILVDFKFSK